MAIREVIRSFGLTENCRCAEPTTDGWQINEWVKKAGSTIFSNSKKWKPLKQGFFEIPR